MKHARYKIKKGDTVQILAGRDRGKQGKVLRVIAKKDRVLVEGLNYVKRHMKPGQQNRQGGIIEKEAPLHISNVAIVDPKTSKPTRIGYKVLEDGTKVRVCRPSGEVLSD